MADSGTDKLWRRAQRYVAANQAAPARAVLESILARDPADARARLYLSGVYASEDQQRASTQQVQVAAARPPDDPALLLELAGAAIRVGEIVIARDLLRHPALAGSSSPRWLIQASMRWQWLGDNAAALDAIEQARRAGAKDPLFHFQRATLLGFRGDLAGAQSELERCIAFDPPLGNAFLQLAYIRTRTRPGNHLAAIEAALARVEPSGEDAAALQFARYKELEDLGHFDEAWRALARGNALVRARRPHDPVREAGIFDRMVELSTPEFLTAVAANDAAGPQPIFVVGMPRSGTTLLERILGNHPQVESAGELAEFGKALMLASDHWMPGLMPDATTLDRLQRVDWVDVARRYLAQSRWRAHGKPFYVDKLPRNWMWAGLIHKAMPQAPILNLVRDPMDVCFSNWRAYLGDGPEYGYAYDLGSLAAHHRQYRRVMAHWHRAMPGVVLDVPYARLVREPERMAQEVFAFCGVAYEPGCADLTRNTTPSATLSVAQVRQPIHARSFRTWQPYARQLAGLPEALQGVAGALTARSMTPPSA